MNCHICGEKKPKEDFRYVMYFSTYKKRKVQWCRECQKMYLTMKKKQEVDEYYSSLKINYLVSFQ